MTPKNATTNASRTHCITSRLTRTCDLVAARWRSTTAPTRNEAPSPEQARAVLEAAHGGDLEALWAVALTTGLRQGELLALRWPEVDLDQGSLRVVASLVRIVGQEPQLVEPKSRRSRRQVELSVGAVDALRHCPINRLRHRSA